MWRVCKEAGRPWPVLDDDPVIDFCIMEAVATKVAQEDNERQERADKMRAWEQDTKAQLEQLRNGTP